jgi:hypothetical protein
LELLMSKSSRAHSSDEFGQAGSSSLSGLDAPMIGASSSIMVDALVESESGITPPPPAISVKAVAIAMAVLFVVGVAGLTTIAWLRPPAVDTTARLGYAADGTGMISGDLDGVSGDGETSGSLSIVTTQTVVVDGQSESRRAEVAYDSSTVFVVNGRPLGGSSATDPNRLTVFDVSGWPVRVQYVRGSSSSGPRATRVEFTASQEMIDSALTGRETNVAPSGP